MATGTEFLTTKSKEWSLRNPDVPPRWTARGNGFFVHYAEDETVPLEHVDIIASAGDGGCVEKCHCPELNSMVAVKRLDTHSKRDTNDKLVREVDNLRMVRYYHCVQILGSFIREDWFNIVMEPVASCDLRTYLMHEGSSHKVRKMELLCGPRTVFLPTIMGCLAHTLWYIHKDPRLRHRDIKPANILLDGRRVLFADFGLSKSFTETESGTSGPSAKTPMYTSPERAKNKHRNKSCDIFSLACVYSEIFTVYKGRTVDEFLKYRQDADPEGDGYFYRTVAEVIRWLDDLATERCDVQIIRLLRSMLNEKPDRRPEAEQVWKILTTCSSISKRHFCGPCCMPLLYNDPVLTLKPDAHPSETEYASSVLVRSVVPVPQDFFFQTEYERDEELGLQWVRNVRHWSHSTLDVVMGEGYPHLLARKRVTAWNNNDGFACANNEAEILRKVKHRHIVTLHGTYRQGDVYALLFEPAANFDLRSYLELTELQKIRQRDLPIDISLLISSFGCLTSALACLHTAGYDHGDIRPENILIHNDRIFLSKFSLGLKIETGGTAGNSSNLHRFIDLFGRLGLGLGRPTEHDICNNSGHPRPTSTAVGQYKPPEWKATQAICVGQPPADIFSLGCVCLEIYTVLKGRRIRDFEKFRADKDGKTAYRDTLPKTLEWLSNLDGDEYESKERFQDILRRMIDPDPRERPSAQEVHNVLRQCMSSDGKVRCGRTCEID